MKKLVSTALLFLGASLFLVAQTTDYYDQNKSQEVVSISKYEFKVVNFFDNGKVKSEAYYLNDEPNGTWIGYNQNGEIETIQNYSMGSRVGNWIRMSKDGRTKYITKYVDNQIVSTSRIDETGSVIASR